MRVALPFVGSRSRVRLKGPSSQILSLGPDTAETFEWAPDDRSQMEVEVRARIIAAEGPPGDIPIVEWRDELGHGDLVVREPHPALAQISGTPIQAFNLPARGMLWRTNARQLRITLRNAGTIVGASLANVTVEVSVLPCSGMKVPQYPYSHFAVAGLLHPMPWAAKEWRLTDVAGSPVGAGPGVLFTGIMGALFGATPQSDYADWQPIPHDAVGFVPDAGTWAAFR